MVQTRKELSKLGTRVDELECKAGYYGAPKPEKTARELFADQALTTVATSAVAQTV